MGEKDYYAVLGVEPENTGEAENGGNESGVADPIEADVEEMQNALEASGEETDTNGTREDEETTPPSVEPTPPLAQGRLAEKSEDEEENPSTASGPPPFKAREAEGKAQSAEENARYAAARRRAEAERDAAVARAQEDAKQYAENAVAELLKKADFTNPYTGEKIRTMAEFEAYEAQKVQEEDKAFVQSTGMTDEQFKAYIGSRPEVQEAARAKQEADRVLREAREREAREKVEAQVKEISALNPAIQSLSDLTKLETYPEIYEKVKRGYSIADAYRLANMADIESRAVARAQQQARNAERTKAHLQTTEARGAGSVEVPADVKAEYRALNPGITDAEIQKHYAGYARR